MNPVRAIGLGNNSRRVLRRHIDKGLELIRKADYETAIDRFQDQAIAKRAGFNLVLQGIKPLRKVETREDAFKFLDIAAGCSGFSKKEIEIYRLVSCDNWLLDTKLKELVGLEEALLFAEEWVHAFQDAAQGALISSHAKEIYSLEGKDGVKPIEVEVADYFLDQGISWDLLKRTHWIERYNRRKILAPFLLGFNGSNT